MRANARGELVRVAARADEFSACVLRVHVDEDASERVDDVVDGLVAYSRSIPTAVPNREMAIKETGFETDGSLRVGGGAKTQPSHADWLARAGVDPDALVAAARDSSETFRSGTRGIPRDVAWFARASHRASSSSTSSGVTSTDVAGLLASLVSSQGSLVGHARSPGILVGRGFFLPAHHRGSELAVRSHRGHVIRDGRGSPECLERRLGGGDFLSGALATVFGG